MRVLTLKLTDFLSLDNVETSESALWLIHKCLFISRGKSLGNEHLPSDAHRGSDLRGAGQKYEYLTNDGMNVEIPNLGGVIFFEIFGSLSYLLKVVSSYLYTKNAVVKKKSKKVYELEFNYRISEKKLELPKADGQFMAIDWLLAQTQAIETDTRECDNDLWGKNLVIMNLLAKIL